MSEDIPDVLRTMARLVADYAVVPFIGAGCSKPHLGYDWAGITAVLASDIGLDTAGLRNTEVAQAYVERRGRDALISRVKSLLWIEEFEDAKGESYLSIANLGLRTYYTTNPDNVFEKFFLKYNRPFASVANTDDLRRIGPDDSVIYKYHGDFDRPQTVVWTEDDYAVRASEGDAFFLNVRLKADLLVKSFLFIGYGIGDEHIRALFHDLSTRYPNAIRGSYVLALGNAAEMKENVAGLGIEVVSVEKMFPGLDGPTALARSLQKLNAEVVALRNQRELEALFAPNGAVRVATSFEIHTMIASLPTLEIGEAIRAFRSTVSHKQLPRDDEPAISDAFVALAERVEAKPHARDLSLAQFGLQGFTTPIASLRILAANLALHVITQSGTGPDPMISPTQVVEETPPLTALGFAMAAEMLESWGRPLNGNFANSIVLPVRGYDDIESLDPELQNYVKHWFERIFVGSPSSNPLTHSVPAHMRTFARKTAQEFVRDMWAAMPQDHRAPDERA